MTFAFALVSRGVGGDCASFFALAPSDASVRGLGDRRIASSLSIAASQCFCAGDGPAALGGAGVAVALPRGNASTRAGVTAVVTTTSLRAFSSPAAASFARIFASSVAFAAARSSLDARAS